MADIEEKPFLFVPSDGSEKTIRNFEGKAKAEFPNGDTYEGLYKNSLKNGYGVYEYLSKTEGVPNDTYKGAF